MPAGPAGAQSYQQAVRACLQGPFDRETVGKHCTTIIDAGRLTPLERAIALNNRAEAGAGNVDAEIRDLDEAIRLAPTIAKLFHNRGIRLAGKPDLTRAIADLDAAIRLDPRYAVAWTRTLEIPASRLDFTAAWWRAVAAGRRGRRGSWRLSD